MKRRGNSLISAAFVALIVLVIFFVVRLTLRHPPEVALPEIDETENSGGMISDTQQEAIRRVEVTPETVQLVIERLERPENYSRTMTILRFWSGGSGESLAEVDTAYGWTRLDMTESGETRHVITGGGKSYVWYGNGTAYYSGAAALTADEEQSIPTYENILKLPTDAIAIADYRTLDTVNCVYVETYPDASGYTERFWIAVDNGLLIASERMQGETVVYRMEGMEVAVGGVTAETFVLPDGTVLLDSAAEPRENVENGVVSKRLAESD